MKQKNQIHKTRERKSIFRSLFIPLFLIMMLQAGIFYFAAVYGGIEESLSQNAADILAQRLLSRKNEIENQFNTEWTDLNDCTLLIEKLYGQYEKEYGEKPFVTSQQTQISFLQDCADQLILTLRQNGVNGVFLILNDQTELSSFSDTEEQKYGLCIRDMDQDNSYTGTEDLLLERAPSSIVDELECSLDSWWEAKYTFQSQEEADYYYSPLIAAFQNKKAAGKDLAYFSSTHQLSRADPAVISYSLPLMDEHGYPFAVLGVEVSLRYLASLLPNNELNEADKSCYILAMQNENSTLYTPLLGTGSLYSRYFVNGTAFSSTEKASTGGFYYLNDDAVKLYGETATLSIYNSNNPFEAKKLVLLAMVESSTLFAYISHIKMTLMIVSLLSLLLGIGALALVSRRFAAPITALAAKVRKTKPQTDYQLPRLGITEIDQLVDSIEELNRNVSKNIARTEFFSRMSHDMRTPMNAIIGFSSHELLDGATEAVKDDYLQKINASGQYLLGLINEVLDMTKIESNKTELHYEPVRADLLFSATIPIIEEQAQKKGVRLQSELEIASDLYLSADRQHVNQIVMNLLSNAVKFTPQDGVVTMKASMKSDAQDETVQLCHIQISDTGIGMSEEFMKTLYTPFEQENSQNGGTGLGLSIAKKLVELMGGTISCESQKGVGTTFHIRLPFTICTDGTDDVTAINEQITNYEILAKKHLLVCEDNAINTQIIEHLLTKEKIIVSVAKDGKAGVEQFDQSEPGFYDAILMDIQMPVMDGLKATSAIRALNRKDAQSIPIIAMTANAFEDDVRACKEAGMNDHLAKPVEPQKLYQTLVRYLNH